MFGKNSKVDAVASSVMQVIEKVTTDTEKGREDGSINSFTPAKVTLKGDVEKKPDPKEPQETPARKTIETKKPTNEAFVQKLKDSAKKVLAKVGGGSDKDQLQRLRDNMYGKKNEEVETVEEGWDDMLKSVADQKKPQPNGGSGIKKGKSYGNQKPEKDEKEVKEGYEGSAEDKKEDAKEAKKRHMTMKEWEKSSADKKHDMKEAKEEVPFDPPYKEKKETVTDKSGAKHTPMSRAKNLARAAMDKIKKDHKLG
jgi:hypothetical protein